MAYVAKLSNAGGVKSLTRYVGVLAGNETFIPSSYESIATITPYTSTTTVVFNSIPSTFTHLQLRASAGSSAPANMTIKLNGDSGTNYVWHYLDGNGASISAGNGTGTGYMLGPVTTNTASAYTGIVMDILDYTNTNKYKTIRTMSGVDLNGAATWLNMFSGAWFNTAAVTSITLAVSGATFAVNSKWALYGIRG